MASRVANGRILTYRCRNKWFYFIGGLDTIWSETRYIFDRRFYDRLMLDHLNVDSSCMSSA